MIFSTSYDLRNTSLCSSVIAFKLCGTKERSLVVGIGWGIRVCVTALKTFPVAWCSPMSVVNYLKAKERIKSGWVASVVSLVGRVCAWLQVPESYRPVATPPGAHARWRLSSAGGARGRDVWARAVIMSVRTASRHSGPALYPVLPWFPATSPPVLPHNAQRPGVGDSLPTAQNRLDSRRHSDLHRPPLFPVWYYATSTCILFKDFLIFLIGIFDRRKELW